MIKSNTTNSPTQPTFISSGLYEFYSFIGSSTLGNIIQTLKEKPAEFALNPFIREILFSNLQEKEKPLILRYFSTINMYLTFPDINLTELANFYATEMFSVIYASYGSEQAFLKTLLTNYSISEEKIQSENLQKLVEQQEQQKKGLFKFP